jgi:hypothetical protein
MILDLAVDDFTGLWELVWRADTVFESVPATDRLRMLQSEVTALVDDRFLDVFEGVRFGGDEQEIAPAAAVVLLADPASWEPPPVGASKHLRIAATPKGRARYEAAV